MAGTLTFRAIPTIENGLTLTTPAIAWQYSDWKVVGKKIPAAINIVGIAFEANFVLSADDAVNEQLFEIGFGRPDNAVVKLQFPHSWRADTRVGFYPTKAFNVFLPEPYVMPALSTFCIRVARGIATAVTYNGIKVLYQSDKELVSPNSKMNMNNYQFVHGTSIGGEVTY